jgi:alpha-mannosidase
MISKVIAGRSFYDCCRYICEDKGRTVVLDAAIAAKPEAILLRLWVQGGRSDNVTGSLPTGTVYTKATLVNLRGEAVGNP